MEDQIRFQAHAQEADQISEAIPMDKHYIDQLGSSPEKNQLLRA
jgi:hypothetical protein